MARDTDRILFLQRSVHCDEPRTWGMCSGEIDDEELPEETALRELEEETGHDGDVSLVSLLVSRTDGRMFWSYLAIVDEEFVPELNWEHTGHAWVTPGAWPQPLHPGVERMLSDRHAHTIIAGVVL